MGERNGKKMLEKDGGYHLADFVTKIIRGTVAFHPAFNDSSHVLFTGSMSSDSANGTPFTSQAVFCTSMGGIGIVFDVNDQNLSLNLSALQRNLAHVAPEAGGGKKKHAGYEHPCSSLHDNPLTLSPALGRQRPAHTVMKQIQAHLASWMAISLRLS